MATVEVESVEPYVATRHPIAVTRPGVVPREGEHPRPGDRAVLVGAPVNALNLRAPATGVVETTKDDDLSHRNGNGNGNVTPRDQYFPTRVAHREDGRPVVRESPRISRLGAQGPSTSNVTSSGAS